MDIDKLKLKQIKFDLIISNFYLHLSNNIDLLFNNINNSLNKNGFFIATIPGNNCFSELKNSMIKADTNLYGGAYQRFTNALTIEKIS